MRTPCSSMPVTSQPYTHRKPPAGHEGHRQVHSSEHEERCGDIREGETGKLRCMGVRDSSRPKQIVAVTVIVIGELATREVRRVTDLHASLRPCPPPLPHLRVCGPKAHVHPPWLTCGCGLEAHVNAACGGVAAVRPLHGRWRADLEEATTIAVARGPLAVGVLSTPTQRRDTEA